jgi:hypothetical protein
MKGAATSDDSSFAVQGDIPSILDGHVEQQFGHNCKAKISPSLLACDMGKMS